MSTMVRTTRSPSNNNMPPSTASTRTPNTHKNTTAVTIAFSRSARLRADAMATAEMMPCEWPQRPALNVSWICRRPPRPQSAMACHAVANCVKQIMGHDTEGRASSKSSSGSCSSSCSGSSARTPSPSFSAAESSSRLTRSTSSRTGADPSKRARKSGNQRWPWPAKRPSAATSSSASAASCRHLGSRVGAFLGAGDAPHSTSAMLRRKRQPAGPRSGNSIP
mmetsp:Transcript_32569/g.95320  ORF Transcript_32569/g.95320 Transcript_32569/m.95320 type:complete len:222 (+) Transcript_32569:1723-2388(+)